MPYGNGMYSAVHIICYCFGYTIMHDYVQHNIDIALVCRKNYRKKGIGGWGYADPNANDLGFEIDNKTEYWMRYAADDL